MFDDAICKEGSSGIDVQLFSSCTSNSVSALMLSIFWDILQTSIKAPRSLRRY